MDEVGYDHKTMMRVRRVLNNGTIDLHSSKYTLMIENKPLFIAAGAFSKSPMVHYMELFPFVDKLWFGDGFNYENGSADYWL